MSPPATPASVPTAAPLHGLPTDRWRRLEVAFWLVAVAAFFVFPQHRVIGNLILITGLFAVSLDLILGYAGIVSLGNVCRWLASKAEGLGVEIYPGFAAAEVLYDDNGAVAGVAGVRVSCH